METSGRSASATGGADDLTQQNENGLRQGDQYDHDGQGGGQGAVP